MPKKKSTRRSKKRRSFSPPPSWIWLLVLIFAGAAVGVLVYLAQRDEQPPERSLPPKVVKPQSVPSHDELMRTEIEAFLATAKLSSNDVQRDIASTPYRYQAKGKLPSEALVATLRERLRSLSNEFAVITFVDGGRLVIEKSGEMVATVDFVPPVVPLNLPPGPKVVIIMDDLGRGTYPARVLLSLEQPVTFAILPGESHAAEVARMAEMAGREVMLHIPMEPQGYPAINPGDDALLVRHSTDEIQKRFRAFLEIVPQAVGANNHMGSRFTEDKAGMSAVMELIRQRDMFFVDSLTTGKSQGGPVAQRYGVPSLKRDVFLDNVADVEKVRHEVQRLVKRARSQGFAVGICHPYPETLEALRLELPRFPEQGVVMVSAGELIRFLSD